MFIYFCNKLWLDKIWGKLYEFIKIAIKKIRVGTIFPRVGSGYQTHIFFCLYKNMEWEAPQWIYYSVNALWVFDLPVRQRLDVLLIDLISNDRIFS